MLPEVAAEVAKIPGRVDLGVQKLDQVMPNWREKVDDERLCMSDNLDCVLGQVFGTFDHGVEMVFHGWWTSHSEVANAGLEHPPTLSCGEDTTQVYFEHLGNEWRARLSPVQ